MSNEKIDPYLRLEVLKLAQMTPSADRGRNPTAEEIVAAATTLEAFVFRNEATGS